jgi:glutathione reductase (NADPH)
VLLDAHTVAVGERKFSAERILVATGGWPSKPDIPGIEHAVTSNEAFFLEELPKHALIVGGGYIAVELAGIFHGLGVKTTQIYRGPLFLRGFDHDVRTFLADEMRKRGIDLQFDTNITAIKKTGDTFLATMTDGTELETNLVMYATGRHPMSADLGLGKVGIALDNKGAIVVNEDYQTSTPSIYAIGDVTDRVNLTPVALAEGMAMARNIYGGKSYRVDYENIPTAVFSQPNIGTVGLTEEQARAKYPDIAIYKSSFTPMKHTLTGSDEKTLMKMIVDKPSDRVLGVHMVGPDAGETTQGLGIALRAGATKAIFDTTIGIHPTAAEELVTMREPVDG